MNSKNPTNGLEKNHNEVGNAELLGAIEEASYLEPLAISLILYEC